MSTAAAGQALAPAYPAAIEIQGPPWQSPLAHGTQVPLFQPEVHIGRLASNDVVLSDPYASRTHAVIRWVPGGYEIEDLGSRGGTAVDGQRVVGRAPLAPGQRIRIGATTLLFHALSPADAAPAGTSAPALVYTGQRRGGLGGWIARQLPKAYWKIFLVGALALAGAEIALNETHSLSWLWAVIPIASALMPLTFLSLIYGEDYLADMPVWIVIATVLSGAILGSLGAIVLEARYVHINPAGGIPFTAALEIALIEETCKAVVVVFFLFNRRLHSEIDGLILGAAAGAGFATLETMGYALTALNGGFGACSASGCLVLVNGVLLFRGLLAIFGHVTWTAILVGAVWRERGKSLLRLDFGVLLAYALAVLLHATWDGFAPGGQPWGILISAVVGFWGLRFFIREAVAREKLGPSAPPPPPLAEALLTYLIHPFRPVYSRPAAVPASSFAGRWRIAPAGDNRDEVRQENGLEGPAMP